MIKGANRDCGNCIICCVYFQIKDDKLEKNAMEHCRHLTLPGPTPDALENGAHENNEVFYTGISHEGNCKIHGLNMPKACSRYRCLWLRGHGDDDDRPDRSMMLFDRAHEVENAIEARPCKPDQEKTEEGKKLCEKMVREIGEPAIVTDFYYRKPTRIIGRPIE